MKAMYIDAPGQVSIKDVEMPVRKEGEVLLKILYGGICGSDLGSYRGTFAYFDYPRIPGHEFSAEVIEADENNAYGIKPGMIVTCNPYFNCGHCYSCEHGIVNACMDNQTMGCQRDGAFQEYITMPIERVYDGKGMDAKTLAAIEPPWREPRKRKRRRQSSRSRRWYHRCSRSDCSKSEGRYCIHL